jgi:hypothetical protein
VRCPPKPSVNDFLACLATAAGVDKDAVRVAKLVVSKKVRAAMSLLLERLSLCLCPCASVPLSLLLHTLRSIYLHFSRTLSHTNPHTRAWHV